MKLLFLMTIILTIQKLLGITDLGWFWVMLPLIIDAFICLGVLILLYVCTYI